MSSDQRQSVRMRTFLKGRVQFNGGAASMDCLIRDLSTGGARLELSETAVLPEVFDLYIPNKDATFRSTLRWRRGGGVGVTFDDPAVRPAPARPTPEAPPEPAPDAAFATLVRRLAELEAENAALRSLLATLSRPMSGAA